MNYVLEIRKTTAGGMIARRNDGLPLTSEDKEKAREMMNNPPCWNCGAITSGIKGLNNANEFYVCWVCAKEA